MKAIHLSLCEPSFVKTLLDSVFLARSYKHDRFGGKKDYPTKGQHLFFFFPVAGAEASQRPLYGLGRGAKVVSAVSFGALQQPRS
jgi:hypothetical protein